MSEKIERETDETKSAQPKAEWVRPAIGRVGAGSAELGDISNQDGPSSYS